LDRERDRLESQGMQQRANAGQGYYDYNPIAQYDYLQQDNYQQEEEYAQPTKMSYMEQKKEELRKYQEELKKNKAGEKPPVYQAKQPAASHGYSEEDMRRMMKDQMEYELAQEMQKMKKENNVKLARDSYLNEEDQDYYAEAYQQYQPKGGYNDPVNGHKAQGPVPAGGKSTRQQSEENKFTLSGYDEKSQMNQSRRSGVSVYETSSAAYGNYDIGQLGKW